MAKQTYTSGQVLTAAQMTTLQANDYNQTVSTKTGSYTLVAADVGTKIVMNSASATTITVNTSLFAAGDTLTLLNIGAGVCTITAGTATVSSSASLALAQYGGGTLYFTSAGVSVFQADDGGNSALTLISTTTIGTAVSTVTVAGCFSATYDNYQIVLAGADSSSLNNLVTLQLNNSTGSTYNSSMVYMVHNSGQGTSTGTNANFRVAFGGDVSDTNSNITLYSPFLVRRTGMTATSANGNLFATSGGVDTNAVSNTGFTISVGADNLTGGTIRVYGYKNS
jgi:hypothetical protein